MNDQCCTRIFDKHSPYRGRLCSRPVRIEVEGKFYCTIHDPSRVAERTKEKHKRWAAEDEVRRRQWAFERESRDAIYAIARGHNDPQALCREILERAGKSVDA